MARESARLRAMQRRCRRGPPAQQPSERDDGCAPSLQRSWLAGRCWRCAACRAPPRTSPPAPATSRHFPRATLQAAGLRRRLRRRTAGGSRRVVRRRHPRAGARAGTARSPAWPATISRMRSRPTRPARETVPHRRGHDRLLRSLPHRGSSARPHRAGLDGMAGGVRPARRPPDQGAQGRGLAALLGGPADHAPLRGQRSRADHERHRARARPTSTGSSSSTFRRSSPTRPATTPPTVPTSPASSGCCARPTACSSRRPAIASSPISSSRRSSATSPRRAAERAIPLAGSEAEQKRISAPAAARARGAPTAAGRAPSRLQGRPRRPAESAAAAARHAAADTSNEQKADNGRITLKSVGAGGREESVTVDIPRPAIPAAVMALMTRKESSDRASQMGDVLADDVGGGLVVLSSITPSGAGPGGAARRWRPARRPTTRC